MMKKNILFFCLLFFSFHLSFSQGVWTWANGADTIYGVATYGTHGSSSRNNTPMAMYECANWTDLQGNFWLFGGVDSDEAELGDLWMYNPTKSEWMWVKGSGKEKDPGNYGTRGIPSLANQPPARGWGAATWTDLNGDLWLYGGWRNIDSGDLNDLWKYNIASNKWTWMQGSSNINVPPVYGTKGIPSPNNNPGARYECSTTWTDSWGNLWIFGGGTNDTSYNDLWKYEITTNEWTWMGGSAPNQNGVYGTMGIPDIGNIPGPRYAYCSWTDLNGKFWLFGGAIPYSPSRYYNDMWKYDPAINEWAWMSGHNAINDTGSYGPLCSSSVNFVPGARFENRARWVDDCGKFWLYGGFAGESGYNDLWNFDPVTLEWTLASGGPKYNVPPVHGTKGVPNQANQPGGRGGAVGWNGNDGAFYLFGGSVCGWPRQFNDLWKYQPDANCPTSSPVPSFNLGKDTTYCGPFSKMLSTGYSNTIWSTGATGVQITVTNPGKYWATVNDACKTVSDTINLASLPAATAGTIAPPADTICPRATISLTITASVGNIQWQSSSNGVSFVNIPSANSATYTTPDLSQTAYYRVKASNSCSEDSSAIAIVKIQAVPVAGISVLTRDSICEGTGITSQLSVSGGSGNIQWQSSADGTHFSPIAGASSDTYTTPRTLAQTTFYRAMATNSCGIDSSNIIIVHIIPAPSVRFNYSINDKQVSFQADSVSSNVTSYAWNFGDGQTSKELNPVHTFDSIKTYYVCLTVYNGSNCSYTYCRYVSTLNTGVETVSTRPSIQLYPNPANNTINLSVNGLQGNYQLKIYNVLGQSVGSIHELSLHGGEDIPIDLKDIAPGTYELILMNDKEYYSKRFVHLR